MYREANRLADELSYYVFSLPLGFHALSSVPLGFTDILKEDVMGPLGSRQVCV